MPKIHFSIDYYISKLPKTSKIKISLNARQKNNYYVSGDRTLLYWAFENIIKNSIDSIDNYNGEILVSLSKEGRSILICLNFTYINNGVLLSLPLKLISTPFIINCLI